jgi:hypothetical protein
MAWNEDQICLFDEKNEADEVKLLEPFAEVKMEFYFHAEIKGEQLDE